MVYVMISIYLIIYRSLFKMYTEKAMHGDYIFYDEIQFIWDHKKYSSGGSTHESMWTVSRHHMTNLIKLFGFCQSI